MHARAGDGSVLLLHPPTLCGARSALRPACDRRALRRRGREKGAVARPSRVSGSAETPCPASRGSGRVGERRGPASASVVSPPLPGRQDTGQP
ncbi:hypothetical protein CU044_3159 [Streptomyces sp. L-9-10]|nr:hypothetical protein CU044_3159 [Streptomyces sp. L-9-10]